MISVNWFDVVSAIAVFGAFLATLWQLYRTNADNRTRDRERRSASAVALYEQLGSGTAVSEAYLDLANTLRSDGTARYGYHTYTTVSDKDFERGGLLDSESPESASAFSNVYKVMWYFERVYVALEDDIVDRDTLFRLMAYRIWWTSQLLGRLEDPAAISALKNLGRLAEEWGDRNGLLPSWLSRCSVDFDGRAPRDLRQDLPPHTA